MFWRRCSLVHLALLTVLGVVLPVRINAQVAGPSDVLAFGIAGRPATYSFDYDGLAVPVALDRDVVQSWLPPRLELADETPFADAQRHPVLLLCGTQSNFARHKRGTFHPPFGRQYDESFVIVPYLRLVGSPLQEDVSFYARLYLNSRQGTEWGRRLFGWPKHCVPIETTSLSYVIGAPSTTARDALVLSRDIQRQIEAGPRGEPPLLQITLDPRRSKTIRDDLPALAPTRAMLEQPTILWHKGRYRRYRMDFDMDPNRLVSVSAKLVCSDRFMPALGAFELECPGVAEEPLGAFRFRASVEETLLD